MYTTNDKYALFTQKVVNKNKKHIFKTNTFLKKITI